MIADIRRALEQRLSPAEVQVVDESSAHVGHAGAREGGHFRVRVVSEHFRGCSQLARHRLVYEAVGALMGRGIHALAIHAQTPEEAARSGDA
ncbi:MAG TPA: BolA family protein [Steroidobacteraceae bacterium]|nr:BolA family protein [Steroidobacteraceae bacterium]